MDPPKKRHASQPARPCEWSWRNEKYFLEEEVKNTSGKMVIFVEILFFFIMDKTAGTNIILSPIKKASPKYKSRREKAALIVYLMRCGMSHVCIITACGNEVPKQRTGQSCPTHIRD